MYLYSDIYMYILMFSESLNTSSANTMLKFLEEPEENILGFFITNNKENIIDTIKSRCQIIMDYYDDATIQKVPKVWESIAINYIKELETVFDETLLYNKNVILPLIHDKKECFYFFQSIFNIYSVLYNKKVKDVDFPEEYEVLEFLLKKEEYYLLKQLQYLSKLLEELNFNLNINLLLDRFVLESR